MNNIEYPELFFANNADWRAWLQENATSMSGVWLRFAKKDSGIVSLHHSGALEEALCFGWIDGQAKSVDAVYYLQKFTPRTKRSLWSKRNIAIVTRLIAEGKMQPIGQAAIDAAKADGRWDGAYDSPANAVVPEELTKALLEKPKAAAFFSTLSKTNRYAITWRLQTAQKAETKARRLAKILDMLEKGEKFH